MQKTNQGLVIGLALGILTMVVPGATSAGAADKAPAGQSAVEKGPKAIIKTKFGEIEIKFFPDRAPKHVENFIKLAKKGDYNATIFHRVIPGFMIQGGDPNTKDLNKKDVYGMGGPGYSVKGEFNDTPHKRGIVSMARSNDPDSAGSQFFIVVEDSPFLDGKYTVFGQVVKGMGVADKIVMQPRDARDNPTERIEMTVSVVE
jgi:peptidyl-prolyl cis-trans isomerase B (cyclophilin B)